MSKEQASQSNEEALQLPLKRRSLEEAISEVDREIKVRVRCYDRWIGEGKLSRIDSVDRIERMQAALSYLNELLEVIINLERDKDKKATLIPLPVPTANTSSSSDKPVTSSGDMTPQKRCD